jgi:hypothetical protein
MGFAGPGPAGRRGDRQPLVEVSSPMFVHHRFIVGACLVAGVVAVGVGLHAAAAPQPPAGASFSWGPSPTPSPSTGTGTSAPGVLPIPTASPSPASSASLGGLQLPLSGLFQQLNSETESTAVGQFSILRDIGDALRDRVVDFLQWVSRGR